MGHAHRHPNAASRPSLDRDAVNRGALVDRIREANEKLVTAGLRSQELAEQADAARRRAEFLNEATEQLAVSLNYDATLAEIARLAVPRFADWCLLDVVDESGAAHRVGVAHADAAGDAQAAQVRRFPPRECFSDPPAQALSSGEVVFIPVCSDEAMLGRRATRNTWP